MSYVEITGPTIHGDESWIGKVGHANGFTSNLNEEVEVFVYPPIRGHEPVRHRIIVESEHLRKWHPAPRHSPADLEAWLAQ